MRPPFLNCLYLTLTTGLLFVSVLNTAKCDAKKNDIAVKKNAAVLDMREEFIKSEIRLSAAEKKRIREDALPSAPQALRIVGRVQGAFTGAGAMQTAYLVNQGNAGGIQPTSSTSRIVIYQNGKRIDAFEVPSAGYLRAALRTRSGTDWLALAHEGTQMGVATTALTFIDFSGGGVKTQGHIDEARTDTCFAPPATQLTKGITAQHITIRYEGDAPVLKTETYRAPCQQQRQTPMMQDFVRVEAESKR
jgi:hypothetical protein